MYYRRMWSTGINRNIVECKDSADGTKDFSVSGINRNIVECKVQKQKAVSRESRVLIETLWNVK